MAYILIFFLFSCVSCKYTQHLKFRNDGTFKITQITDLHFAADDDNDRKANELQSQNLKLDQPDLAVFTGDSVSDYSWNGKEKGFFEKYWMKYTNPVTSLKIPYALVLGNHDGGYSSREQIVALDQTNEYSMTERGPKYLHGVTNYYIPIYDEKDENVEMILWFFDSMAYECLGVKNSWGCVYPDVIEWYMKESNKINEKYNRTVKGLAFYHIPQSDFFNAAHINKIVGNYQEDVACPLINTGLVAAMIKQGNIMGVFVGHDHVNDFTVNYYGLNLTYGAKTGYSGYGEPAGTRGIVLSKNSSTYYTYIRNKNGLIQNSASNRQVVQFKCPDRSSKNGLNALEISSIMISVLIVINISICVGIYIWKRKTNKDKKPNPSKLITEI